MVVGALFENGVVGDGIATVSVQLVIVAIYYAAVRALEGDTPRPPSTRADIAEIVRYGLPIGGQLFAEIGIFGVATVIAAHMGKLPSAANLGELVKLVSFTFSVAVGTARLTACASVTRSAPVTPRSRDGAGSRPEIGPPDGVLRDSVVAPRLVAGLFTLTAP